MLQDAKGSDETELLAVMNDTLTQTGILHEALKETGAFPGYLLNMVRIGEQTGRLDDVMQSLAEYYEKEASLCRPSRTRLLIAYRSIYDDSRNYRPDYKVMPVFNQVFKQPRKRNDSVLPGPSFSYREPFLTGIRYFYRFTYSHHTPGCLCLQNHQARIPSEV